VPLREGYPRRETGGATAPDLYRLLQDMLVHRAPDGLKREASHLAQRCMDGLHDRLPADSCGFCGLLEGRQYQMAGIAIVVLLLTLPVRHPHPAPSSPGHAGSSYVSSQRIARVTPSSMSTGQKVYQGALNQTLPCPLLIPARRACLFARQTVGVHRDAGAPRVRATTWRPRTCALST